MSFPNQVMPAMPSFADLQAQMLQQPPNTMSAPSGGANSLPAPVATPGGQGFSPPPTQPVPQPAPVPESYLSQLERAGKVPAGQFRSERELIDALYSTAEDLANRVEQRPPETPVAPAPTVAPSINSDDLNKAATMFQQQGWLSMSNGQWVASNPIAQGAAQQLNTSMLEAQARQAELSDPSAFIAKYGKSVIEQALTPFQQRLAEMETQNHALQARLAETIPRPDKQWVEANKVHLWTTDQAGAQTPTPAGKLYGQAWDMAQRAGINDLNQIHEYALQVVQPYITQTQPAAPQPQVPWMQQVQNSPGSDPSFTSPGPTFSAQVPPSSIGIPVGNDGFPQFSMLQAMGSQGR